MMLSPVSNMSDCRSRDHEFDSVWYHTFSMSDHIIIYTAILLLPLIQEGLLSVTSESMCTKYWLTTKSSLPWKTVAR